MSFALEPGDETASLVGLLDELLDQGVHVAGDLVIGLADVDLIRASLRLLIASEDTARRTGREDATPAGDPPAPGLGLDAGKRGAGSSARGVAPPPCERCSRTPDATSGPALGREPRSRPLEGRDDDQRLVDGVARLVLTVVAVIHDLVERQAIRRVEAGALSDDQVERLGVALQALEERMADVRDVFGIRDEDLDLDLGPLGHLR